MATTETTSSSTVEPDCYELRNKPREEFNKIRRILLRNIPPSTEGEIQEFLGSFKAKKIEISESLDSAVVTLEDGSQLEDAVAKLDNGKLKDNDVAVSFCASDKLLCVAHLPPRYSDDEFRKLIAQHGQVKYCFIMRSEKTGHSKSYGFLEFEEQDMEKLRKVRDSIDWKEVGSHMLHADFVEPAFQTWERLQSRCLAVTGLPKDFTEISKLREAFSVVTSPVYCQIMMHEKESLGMGIVEFRKAEEAEETWDKLRGTKIEDSEITITFCIPSKSAVVVNNRIMWKFSDKMQQKSSLLPDPVSTKPVISNNSLVLSLIKQNPNLMDDFTKVLLELHQAYVQHMMSPGNKPGLLGPAPSLPMSPMMNPHLQMGLITMLVLHIHAEKKEPFTGMLAKQLNTLSDTPASSVSAEGSKKPSILGDPLTAQANILLTNLKQQLNQVAVTEEKKDATTSTNPAVRSIMNKFVQNARFLNLSLLVNLGQVVMGMQATNQMDSPVAQAAAAAATSLARHTAASILNPPGSGKGLLGDVPKPNPNPAAMRFMQTLEAVATQKLGSQNQGFLTALMSNINTSHSTMGNIEKKTSLLGDAPARPPHHQHDSGPMGSQGGAGMGGGGMGGGMGGMGGGGMGGGMGGMGGGMGGGGMGNMGTGMGGMGNMGGGMGGGMGNMGGGMGNMGGGMGGMGNMDGMGGNMSGMGGGMGQQGGMGGKGGWGSGAGRGASLLGAGNTAGGAGAGGGGAGNKAESYSTFGSYSGGYGDMGGYGGGYTTEEYSQFGQGDYSSGGYGDGMYSGDQSGYQYGNYGSGYGTGQDSYNFQGSTDYSGNFGDYTGGYNSSSGTGSTGFAFGQNQQQGSYQDGSRYSGSGAGGGAGGSWGGMQGGASGTATGMGQGMRSNMAVSKNLSGGGAGPGGGGGVGAHGAGQAFGSSATTQGTYGGAGGGGGARQGLLDTPSSGMKGAGTTGLGAGFSGTGGGALGRQMGSTDSYQTSATSSYMGGTTGSSAMASYSSMGYSTNDMEGYNTTAGYDDTTTGNGYGYGNSMTNSMGYGSYNQSSAYGGTTGSAGYSTGGTSAGMMNTAGQLTPAGSKRSYSHLLPKPEPSPEGEYVGQHSQGLGGHYEKRPRLF